MSKLYVGADTIFMVPDEEENVNIEELMNKETKKIYKKLKKDIIKNKKQLRKYINKWLETEDTKYLADIEYFVTEIFDDEQDITLIEIALGVE